MKNNTVLLVTFLLCYIFDMGALKDFINQEKQSTEDMTHEELAAEVGGWRALCNMLPNEVLEWVVRLGEPYRLITRKYEPKTGLLTRVKFEVLEFDVELQEQSFDSVRGVSLIEYKLLTIGKEAVLYGEEIITSQDREDWEEEINLGAQSLER